MSTRRRATAVCIPPLFAGAVARGLRGYSALVKPLVLLARTVAAGLAATWVMDRVDKVVYLLTPERVHRREAQLEELTGPGAAARALARLGGRELDHDAAVRWGRVVHNAFGVTMAFAYRPLAHSLARGALFGLAMWPAQDGVVPALGLTPRSSAFPLATRVRTVLYHIGYGVALDAALRGFGAKETE